MSDLDQLRHADHDWTAGPSATPRTARAGAGFTTRSILPRPTSELPQAVQRKESTATPNLAQPAPSGAWLGTRPPDPFSLVAGLDWDRDVVNVQAKADADLDPATVQRHAAAGVAGTGSGLPHLDQIQRSFGEHDVSGIRAHVGGAAASASAAIGAEAYATGDAVAFGSTPDLHTAAHEAAHVIQQRGGVQLKGGVGQAGDPYERHADAVADAVVAGRSAADLLGQVAPGGGAPRAVQRKGASAEQMDDTAGGMLTLSPAVAELAHALAQIESAETDAKNLLERWQARKFSTTQASVTLATIMDQMVAPLDVFMAAERRAASRRHDPLEAASLDRSRPRVRDSLNNVSRVVLKIRQVVNLQAGPMSAAVANANPDERAAVEALASRVRVLAITASDLGWEPPRSVDEADAERYAHEACPTGARDERPSHCNLPDSERVELRGNVARQAQRALASFQEACQPHKDRLDAMIKSGHARQKLIVEIFTEVVTTAISVGAVAGSAFTKKLGALGLDVVTSLATSITVEGEGTQSMLASLFEAVDLRLQAVVDTVRQLDDRDLLDVSIRLINLTPEQFSRRLAPFVAAYHAQIDPLGRGLTFTDSSKLVTPPGTHFTYEAVRVEFPGLDRDRLAQVAHEANYSATAATTPEGKQPVHHRFIFVRWIDDQFEPMLHDAPRMRPGQIEGLEALALVAR